MLRFIKVSKKPQMLFRLTGLTLEQFTTLLAKRKPLWEQAEKKRLFPISMRTSLTDELQNAASLCL